MLKKALGIFVKIFLFLPVIVNAAPIKFKIGFIVPLSGDLAYAGKDIQNGVELALQDVQHPEIEFETLWEDSRYEAKLSVSAAHKLISQDKVDLLVAIWDTADVVAPIAEQFKVPLLAIRWNHHIAEKFTYTMTMESTYQSYVTSQLKLLSKMGVTKVALLTEEAPGCILAADYLKSEAQPFKIEIVGEEVINAESFSHKTSLLRLVGKKPQVVVLTLNPVLNINILKEFKQVAPKVHLLGYFDIVQEEVLSLIEGLPFVAQFKTATDFNQKFEKKYGHKFKARAPQAYDLIKILVLIHSGMKNKLQALDLIEAFKKIRGIEGAAGTLDSHGSKTIESQVVWKIVKNGKHEYLDEDKVTSKLLRQ